MTTLHDERAEAALTAAALFSDAAARAFVDRGVRSDQITHHRYRLVFAAVEDLVARNVVVDKVTVLDRLGKHLDTVGGERAIDELYANVPAVGAMPHVADIVIDLARWRHRQAATSDISAAIGQRDPVAFERAQEQLAVPDEQRARQSTFTPEQAGAAFLSAMNAGTVERFLWPFDKLNFKSRGGAKRGQVTVLAGPVTHGKSALLDQTLDTMAAPDHRVHLYLNEMTPVERMSRVAARRSGVELTAIEHATSGHRPLDGPALQAVEQGLRRQSIGMTDCVGWTPERICRHARRNQFDIVAIDIVQRLAQSDGRLTRTAFLDHAANQFDRLSKEAGMHVILVAHLNRERAKQSGRPPIPTMSDIKDCAGLVEIADNVLFVWRESDTSGDPSDQGQIRFAKCRGGEQGGLQVRFDGEHQRFLPLDDRHLEVVA